MDSNIDPSIAEQEVFHVPALPDHSHKDDREDLPNVFRLNEYVAEHLSHNDLRQEETGSTAAAALNMIQYGFDSVLSDPHQHHQHHQQTANHSTDFPDLSHAHGEFDLPTHLPIQRQSRTLTTPVQGRPSRVAPVARDFVTVVPYNPNEKPKRLGRPRKHNSIQNLNLPEDNSALNVNESMVSKFRFDFLPVEGPGSRGGKMGSRRTPRGRIVSNRMNMGLGPVEDLNEVESKGRRTRRAATPKTESPVPKPADNSLTDELINEFSAGQSEPVDIHGVEKGELKQAVMPQNSASVSALDLQENNKKLKLDTLEVVKQYASRTGPSKKKSLFDQATSITGVISNKNKLTRLLPGPLVGLNYSLYDDNLLRAKANESSVKEKVALGFPVAIAPHAQDIMRLISFLNKYKDVVFGKEIYYIGPKDFEIGLSLTRYTQTNHEDEFVNFKDIGNEQYDPNFISPLMTLLFCKLLKLVLNKKKDISTKSQAGAISELKSLVSVLGLPKEWINSDDITQIPLLEGKKGSEEDDQTGVFSEKIIYNEPIILYNPFKDPEFEKHGLKGLDPDDRLIMLRTLMEWSLTLSETLKLYMAENTQYQDIDGERSTYYVARSVLKGFKHTEDVANEAEAKLAKRSNNKKEEDSIELKYVDPTSDPLAHALRWRTDEMFIGDGGFNIGRFYLCRMADGTGGGLTSLKRMQSVFTNFRELRDIPSSFKLYVEDVHQMLVEDLFKFGVEFDESGNEVMRGKVASGCNWYEVASNADEINKFIEHLTLKLELVQPVLQKQITSLRNFLTLLSPLITYQESVSIPIQTNSGESSEKIGRSTRKKEINYSDFDNAAKMQVSDDDELGEYVDDIDEEILEPDDEDDDYLE